MQMEQMPKSNKSALKRAHVCGRHCYGGQSDASTPAIGDGETVAAPSVGCFVRERLEVDHCDGGRLQSHSAFVGEFYHLISTFTSE